MNSAVKLRLDTLETSLRSRTIRDRNGIDLREKALAAYEEVGYWEKPARQVQRMRTCGEYLTVYADPDGNAVLGGSYCKSRLCPNCRYRRYRQAKIAIGKKAGVWDNPKFLTLTLRSSDLPLGAQLDKLLVSFRRLRRKKVFASLCKAGVWCVEITFNPKTGLYHPHVHAIMDSKFIDKKWLSDTWLEITGDSYIVDIKRCDKATVSYLAKYVAKGGLSTPLLMDPQSYAEMLSRRVMGGWGKAGGFALKNGTDLTRLGSLRAIIACALGGDTDCIGWCLQIAETQRIPWTLPP